MIIVGIYSTLTQARNNSIQELLFSSTVIVYVNQPMGFDVSRSRTWHCWKILRDLITDFIYWP